MIVVITLKKLDKNTKRAIKQHYSLLEFKKSQVKKNIPELGDADILLFELDISMIFNIKNNIIYKYLKSQDLTSIKVVWVYESTKYKNLINNVNVFLRKFPLLHHKNIDEALELQVEKELDIKSKFEPPEQDHEINFDKLQDTLTELINDYKQHEQKQKELITEYIEQLQKLQVENDRLHEELKKIDVKQKLQEIGLEEPEDKKYHKKTGETFKYIIDGRTIKVISNMNGVIHAEGFKSSSERVFLMKKLRQEFR